MLFQGESTTCLGQTLFGIWTVIVPLLVIHGCIDGFSRWIIFLKCSNNNYATSVQELFLKAVEADGGLWLSQVRVDRRVENVLVCETMVNIRGEGRGGFIAGPSTRNQRIKRLWRQVFRCVAHFFTTCFMHLNKQVSLMSITTFICLFSTLYSSHK